MVEEVGPLLLARLLGRLDQVHGLLELGREGAELRAHGVALHHLATEPQAPRLTRHGRTHTHDTWHDIKTAHTAKAEGAGAGAGKGDATICIIVIISFALRQ